MEMIDKNKNSAFIMIFGLILLLVPAIYIYAGLGKIEQMIHLRANSTLLQDEFSDYGNLLKDEVLASAMKIPVADVGGKRNIQIQLNNLEKTLAQRILSEPSLQQSFQSIVTYRARLSSENLKTEELLEIQNQVQLVLNSVDADLQDKLDIQFSALKKEISFAALICLISVCIAFVLVGFSIVTHIRQSRRMRSYANELLVQKEKAEKSDSLKAAFLSTVSHEIRTPLNGIIGLSDAIIHSDDTTSHVKLVKTIHQSGRTLLRIVNDILDFSKIDSGNLSLENVQFAISEVIDQVHTTLSPIAKKKNISMHFEIDEQIPKYFKGDPTRVSQILYNFVGNAIKFTEIGSVIIRAMPVPGQPKVITVSIQDTGVGMSPKEQEQIFKPFYQVHRAGTSGEAGTGLGLAIAKKLIEAMDGHVSMVSEPGHGTRFTFDLAFSESSNEKLGSSQPSSLPSTENSDVQSAHKVLIVDDNPTNQIVAQSLLAQLGISSLSVSNGKEAVDICSKTGFDLVLMDLQMPEMNGFEATQQLRQNGFVAPVIALTANADTTEVVHCFEAGMDGVITKPVTMDDIRNMLSDFLTTSTTVDIAILGKLADKIGPLACTKVIQSYLKTLLELNSQIAAASREKNIEQIHRLSHKYLASSATVGALKLAEIFKAVESMDSLNDVSVTAAQIPSLLRRTRQSLEYYLETQAPVV